MASRTGALPPPSRRAVLITMLGWAGLAACLTLVYLAMRSVMDIGGACADGGPYVPAQSCPEGSTAALLLGIFGGMGSAFLASIGGIGVGGIWAATPILAWSALFGALGWNFIDYGIVNPPFGQIEWGWAICGILFWGMAAFPLLGLVPMLSAGRKPARYDGGEVVRLRGPGQPARPATVRSVTTTTFRRSVDVVRRRPAAEQEELADIAAGFGAAITAALADVPVDPAARAGGDASSPDDDRVIKDGERRSRFWSGRVPTAEGEPDFTEGTQALLDRLERLADMRDRGLLGADEYETAKATIMSELEGRT